jgi:hypothetical protein
MLHITLGVKVHCDIHGTARYWLLLLVLFVAGIVVAPPQEVLLLVAK